MIFNFENLQVTITIYEGHLLQIFLMLP